MKEKVEYRMISELHHSQLGSTKLYALVAIVFIGLLIHAGWNCLPVIYQCENFKAEMQTAVIHIASTPKSGGPDTPVAKLKKRIRAKGDENGVPANALIEVTENGGDLKAHVKFTRDMPLLPFGLFNYHYEFENSVSS